MYEIQIPKETIKNFRRLEKEKTHIIYTKEYYSDNRKI